MIRTRGWVLVLGAWLFPAAGHGRGIPADLPAPALAPDLFWAILCTVGALGAAAYAWHMVLLRRFRVAVRELEASNRELQASERGFRELVELAADGILVGSPEGMITLANSSVGKMLGMAPTALVGKDIRELFPARELARKPLRFDLLERGETVVSEREALRSDGTTVLVEMHSKKLPDGCHHAFVRDITERRRTEAELHRKTTELEYYFNSALDLFCIADTGGNFLRVNREWERLLGYATEDLERRPFMEFVHPDDREATLAAMGRLAEQEEVLNFTNRYRAKDGSYRSIEWRSAPHGSLIYAAARDITDRIRMEEALKRSEATYREIFNAVHDAIYIHEPETGEILDVNDRFFEMFGYTAEAARSLSVGEISSGVHPYTQERAAELLAKAAAGAPQVFEWHCRHRDGHLFWAEVSLQRGRIDGKERVLAIERDITERKREQESLQRTQFAMDRAMDSILWVDGAGRVAYANDSACASLGYSREELLGMEIFEVDPDFPRDQWEQHKEAMRSGGSMSFESRQRTKSGRTFPVEVSANYFDFGGEWMSCAFVRDIRERKRREKELAESRRMLREVLDTIPVRVFWKDVEGRYLGCNRHFSHDAGMAHPEDVVGKDDFAMCWAEQAERYREDDRSVIETGGGKLNFEEPRTTPAGRRIWLRTSKIPLRDGGGRVCGVLGVYEDITERKVAEQQLEVKNKELEQIVYVTSHDLRSPLVNVDGYGRELEFSLAALRAAGDRGQAGLAEVLRAEIADMGVSLRHIRNSTRQMDNLIKGLLKLSRTGRASLAIAAVDMDALLAEEVGGLEFQIRKVGARVRVGELPPCLGDAVQLGQVFRNLLGNALKFLDPGRPGLISVSGRPEHGKSVYCVEDNGIGIAPEHQSIIFELFHRLDPGESEGEGLGLTIVRQILVRLDGEVWLDSVPGVGSRFHVSLPAVRQDERS